MNRLQYRISGHQCICLYHGGGEIIQVQIMFYGKNKNEGKTQMVQQLEVICAMIPVHICHYKPDIQEKTTTSNHQIYWK